MRRDIVEKILDEIPVQKRNASKKQTGSSNVGVTAASRKAQTKSAIDSLTRDLAK